MPSRHCPGRAFVLVGWFMFLVALAAPALRAQEIANTPPLPLNQSVTFRYTDADGMGTITLTDLGPDSATGGDQLLVNILQKGVRYSGSGISLKISDNRPDTYLVTFDLLSPGGTSYFFQGKMGLGVEFQGH